jgi:hypothetical protein
MLAKKDWNGCIPTKAKKLLPAGVEGNECDLGFGKQ